MNSNSTLPKSTILDELKSYVLNGNLEPTKTPESAHDSLADIPAFQEMPSSTDRTLDLLLTSHPSNDTPGLSPLVLDGRPVVESVFMLLDERPIKKSQPVTTPGCPSCMRTVRGPRPAKRRGGSTPTGPAAALIKIQARPAASTERHQHEDFSGVPATDNDHDYGTVGTASHMGAELDTPESTGEPPVDFGKSNSTPGHNEPEASSPSKSERLFNAMPAWTHPIIREMRGDPGLVAACMMGAISIAAGKNYVLVDGQRNTLPNIYVMCGCPAAYGKTIILRDLLHSVYGIEEARKAHQVAPIRATLLKNKRLVQIAMHKLRNSAVRAMVREDLETLTENLAKLDMIMDDLKRELLVTGGFLVNDATAAGLKRTLDSAFCQYIGMICSDAREFCASLIEPSKQANTLRQIILDGYSGDTIKITRGSGTLERDISNPRMTILALTQPDNLRGFFSWKDNHRSGMCSRILFFHFDTNCARPSELTPASAQAWEECVNRVHPTNRIQTHQIENIPLMRATDGADRKSPALPPRRILLVPEARERLRALDLEFNEARTSADNEWEKSMWLRADEQLRRLSLCRALLRQDFEADPCVQLDDVEAANTILRVSAETFLEMRHATDTMNFEDTRVTKLREILHHKGGSMLLEDLKGTGISKDVARKIAETHPGEFRIESAKTGTRGKPPLLIRSTSFNSAN